MLMYKNKNRYGLSEGRPTEKGLKIDAQVKKKKKKIIMIGVCNTINNRRYLNTSNNILSSNIPN